MATKALNTKNYGILYPADILRDKVTSKGLWFWPTTPQIDEDGIADFSAMEKEGLIQVLSQRKWDERQYLWPIPHLKSSLMKHETESRVLTVKHYR